MDRHEDNALLSQFIAAFEKLDDLWTCQEMDAIGWTLSLGELSDDHLKRWRPFRCQTDRSAIDDFYKACPHRLPPLFEELVLGYRWAQVDLGRFRLLANPPGSDFNGILSQMRRDKALWKDLIANGYVQFGMASDLNYDPVCFDTSGRQPDGDCRVVQIDHEEILCNGRIREIGELARSFRLLMIQTIDDAK